MSELDSGERGRRRGRDTEIEDIERLRPWTWPAWMWALWLGRLPDPLHFAVAVGFFPLYLLGVFGHRVKPRWRPLLRSSPNWSR